MNSTNFKTQAIVNYPNSGKKKIKPKIDFKQKKRKKHKPRIQPISKQKIDCQLPSPIMTISWKRPGKKANSAKKKIDKEKRLSRNLQEIRSKSKEKELSSISSMISVFRRQKNYRLLLKTFTLLMNNCLQKAIKSTNNSWLHSNPSRNSPKTKKIDRIPPNGESLSTSKRPFWVNILNKSGKIVFSWLNLRKAAKFWSTVFDSPKINKPSKPNTSTIRKK